MNIIFTREAILNDYRVIEKQLRDGDQFEDLYGCGRIVLTKQDKDHLISGGGLLLEVGEYHCVIVLADIEIIPKRA